MQVGFSNPGIDLIERKKKINNQDCVEVDGWAK